MKQALNASSLLSPSVHIFIKPCCVLEKISFELFGLTLLEPLSTLMNWIMAAQCAYYYSRLRGADNAFQKYWSWFFLTYAISLTFGGLSHLLYHYTGLYGKIPGWSLAILSVTAGEMAMISDLKDEKKKQMLLAVIRSKLFASFVLLFMDLSFKWVMFQTSGLFLFVGILSWNRQREGQKNYAYFLYGMACLAAMATVKIAKVDLHPAWFNRDDIAHVFMILAYWSFFRAIRKVKQIANA